MIAAPPAGPGRMPRDCVRSLWIARRPPMARASEASARRIHDVLIKVYATTVTAGDWRSRSRLMPRGFGLIAPPGSWYWWTAPAHPWVGAGRRGRVGRYGRNQVQSWGHCLCFHRHSDGVLRRVQGAWSTMERWLSTPANLGHEDAAALSFGGTTALGFLRNAGIKAGDRVGINGASGGVGTAAVQLAKHFGAEVTGGMQHRQSRTRDSRFGRRARDRLHVGGLPREMASATTSLSTRQGRRRSRGAGTPCERADACSSCSVPCPPHSVGRGRR